MACFGFSLSFVPFFGSGSMLRLVPLAFFLFFPSVLGQDFLAFDCFCVCHPSHFWGWVQPFGVWSLGFLPLFPLVIVCRDFLVSLVVVVSLSSCAYV